MRATFHPRRIVLFSPSLESRDAVSLDLWEMSQILREAGHEVLITAARIDSDSSYQWDLNSLRDFLNQPRSVLIYHHSCGWMPAAELLKSSAASIVVRYHNVTPPHFFADLNVEYYRACQQGREQTAELARGNHALYVSDSSYNQNELLSEGVPPQKCRVLPPFHDMNQLQLKSDSEWDARLQRGGTTFLSVGRIAPNKRHDRLLEAFARYRATEDADAQLFIVGKDDPRLKDYSQKLRLIVQELGIQNSVHWLGSVSYPVLHSLFVHCSAFIVSSEHEGFCVPAAEAMAFGLPIVAYANTAITETIGSSGYLVEDSRPEALAAAMSFAMKNPLLRSEWSQSGKARYKSHYSRDVNAGRLVEWMNQLPPASLFEQPPAARSASYQTF